MINVLFVGDVNGKPGRQALKALLPLLKKEKEVDFVIANGENSAGGFGITKEKFLDLLSAGVDVVTTGNHVWDKKETLGFIDAEKNLLRPANFPPDAPGRGFGIYDFQKNNTNHKIGVVNLIGRIFMSPADCPFRRAESVISEISAATKNIIVDFHAEATSEKQALGFFLDGKASAVIGSHTHVQTADERVLEDRTAFITDAGMTGPFDSVIGVEKEIIIKKFITGIPAKFDISKKDVRFNGVLVKIDSKTGRAGSIERISIKHE